MSQIIRCVVLINWASVSEPIITWTVSMAFVYVCMYVHTVVIPYYVLIQNYMTTSVKWKISSPQDALHHTNNFILVILMGWVEYRHNEWKMHELKSKITSNVNFKLDFL